MPGNGGILNNGDKQLNITNNVRILTSDDGAVDLGVNNLFDVPVYWQLPKDFLGDMVGNKYDTFYTLNIFLFNLIMFTKF